MRQSLTEKTFNILNYTALSMLALLTLYPFVYVFSASISSPDAVITGKVLLFPREITLKAYEYVFNQSGIWTAYANTVFYTVVGTAVNMLVTTTGAYALSKKRLVGRRFIMYMIAFTMWFNAGMIPFFLNVRQLNLYNSRWGIILAFSCIAFYVILMRTYFQSIPESLEESAIIDGANDFSVFCRIYLPLSVPALATISLYYAIGRWNGYFWSMVLLRDENKIPLQVLIRKLVVVAERSVSSEQRLAYDRENFSEETFRYSAIMVSTIPMIVIYPFIQRFFVKGIMLGSIKG